MKIMRKEEAVCVSKPEGTNLWYYLFDEYELHYNELPPGATQQWHCHDKIEEAVFVISGQMRAEWIEDGARRSAMLSEGDFSRSENSVHTFTNTSSDVARFIVLKLILDGTNKREIFKTDKRPFRPEDIPSG